jgi:hypothetical protein
MEYPFVEGSVTGLLFGAALAGGGNSVTFVCGAGALAMTIRAAVLFGWL